MLIWTLGSSLLNFNMELGEETKIVTIGIFFIAFWVLLTLINYIWVANNIENPSRTHVEAICQSERVSKPFYKVPLFCINYIK